MIELSDRIMFEVYRAAYDLSDRVVYYSELEDKDDEIDRALAGRPSYDGFIRADHIDEAKDLLDGVIKRLSGGEDMALWSRTRSCRSTFHSPTAPLKKISYAHTILCGFLISAQDLVHGRECVPSELVNHSQL